MVELAFECLNVRPDRYGTGPTLLFRLRVTESRGEPVHSIALRCQIRIEPQRRTYAKREEELLGHLFGDRARWGQTLKPMQFTTVSVLVPGFTGSTEVDVPVACTYDMEVAAGKYFHSLDDGEIPMVLLFSGSIFASGERGFQIQQIPWDQQVTYRMPVAVWRELMDLYFPQSNWIRLRNETVDALLRYQAKHAIPTWDAAVESLMDKAGEAVP